jgi:hypothetical protein
MKRFDNAPMGPIGICADVAMVRRDAIPVLRHEAPTHHNGWSGSITNEHGFFHRIGKMSEFFAALGFREEKSGGVLPEEFIWERYTRDGAPLSPACIQGHYAVYLRAHSDEFRQLYGKAFEELAGQCTRGRDHDHCGGCPMHPDSPPLSDAQPGCPRGDQEAFP